MESERPGRWMRIPGPALVALGAALWATDGPFRVPLVGRIDPLVIVFFEHLFGGALLSAWILYRRQTARLLALSAPDWLAAALIGAGGSAAANLLFTSSFRYLNPSVVILLQKLQPILVVLVAFVFLGERPRGRFYPWAVVALGAALVLSFPDLDFLTIAHGTDLRSRGVLYAVSAAALWAGTTVAGKHLLRGHSTATVTFWRYAFGFLASVSFLSVAGRTGDVGAVFTATPGLLPMLLYIGTVPGLLAMLAYYSGLARTPASVATFLELVYPITAVTLNTWLLHTPLVATQIVAACVLIFAVTRISR